MPSEDKWEDRTCGNQRETTGRCDNVHTKNPCFWDHSPSYKPWPSSSSRFSWGSSGHLLIQGDNWGTEAWVLIGRPFCSSKNLRPFSGGLFLLTDGDAWGPQMATVEGLLLPHSILPHCCAHISMQHPSCRPESAYGGISCACICVYLPRFGERGASDEQSGERPIFPCALQM